MTKAKEQRETAEERFERVRKVVAKEAEDDLAAVRKKTARLKALREEKEAAERQVEPEKPARPSRRKRS
jgi:outer membrane protein TolC